MEDPLAGQLRLKRSNSGSSPQFWKSAANPLGCLRLGSCTCTNGCKDGRVDRVS
jgi:hypothetical protein